MIACACLAAEPVIVDGSPRMRQRPIAEGVDMLRQLGARIEYIEEEGRLPVRVVPSEDFKGGELTLGRTVSSQFISAVMLIGTQLPHGVRILFGEPVTSSDYIFLTAWTMEQWLIDVPIEDPLFSSERFSSGSPSVEIQKSRVRYGEYTIEPDASSAAYWFAAAALTPGARARVPIQPLGSCQPDRNVPFAFNEWGCDLELIETERGRCTDSAIIGPAQLQPTKGMEGEQMPDAAVAIGAAAAMCAAPVHIAGLHTLRVKETDRIAALANELRRIGCTVETTEDSITIDPSTLHEEPVIIETYNDHRMAMAFAVLGLARPGISIRNPKCVKKSYPGFWADFAKLYQ
jgi:3-phosphoshikimate 1-carboxyvinyltransferase